MSLETLSMVPLKTAVTADEQEARSVSVRKWLAVPVCSQSLVVFRICFGIIMALWAFDYLRTGRVRLLCAPGVFHFTYDGFSWVQPWPGHGMVLQFVVMTFAALMVSVGIHYRVAAILFALGFTHFFLIDRTNYQNHYYLVVLLSWAMAVLPANRQASLDVYRGFIAPELHVPRWCLLLIQFHIALPYVFGGIAKIEADWLSGQPMYNILRLQGVFDWTERFLDDTVVSSLFTWGGLLFDLLIVPAVLWKRTRSSAFLLAVGFHLCNAMLFRIHIFPSLMIAATTIFFEPDWPARFLKRLQNRHFGRSVRMTTDGGVTKGVDSDHRSRVAEEQADGSSQHVNLQSFASAPYVGISLLSFVLLTVYVSFHLLWPFRHFLYEGNAAWTEKGHFFAWRMMLRGKTVGIRYYLTNPDTGFTQQADFRHFLRPDQQIRFAKDPEMILDLAHGLAAEVFQRTGRKVQVRALALASLNGRRPQMLIDPSIDLAAEPQYAWQRPWIVPLHEPRRDEPWTVPLDEWEQHVDLPELPYLNTTF